MRQWTGAALRRLALEFLGWTLLIGGVAAIPLPGPGLLILFTGLVVLSQQYVWAERRVEPVKRSALKAASDSVQSVPRILVSLLGCAWLVGLGIVWALRVVEAPGWWPVRESWWMPGGWATGATLIASGLFALGLIVYSFRRFRGHPYDPARDRADDARDAGAPTEVG